MSPELKNEKLQELASLLLELSEDADLIPDAQLTEDRHGDIITRDDIKKDLHTMMGMLDDISCTMGYCDCSQWFALKTDIYRK